MTTLSASDIAARRIREIRDRHGWTVKDLAARCAAAGAARLTPAVITNLETRRRPGREISAEELLALAWVLEVPPVLLLSPLDAGETLQVTPGHEKGALEAAAWIADDDAVFGPLRIAREHERTAHGTASRWVTTTPLTLLRQIRVLSQAIRARDRSLRRAARDGGEPSAADLNALTVYGMRLGDLTAWLAGLGHEPPALPGAEEILRRWDVLVTGMPSEGMPDPAVDAWQDAQEVPGGPRP